MRLSLAGLLQLVCFALFHRGSFGCTEYEYECSDGSCVNEEWVCDGWDDCYDGGDEHCECRMDEFKCSSGDCIPWRYVCDGHVQCPDGDDEYFCEICNVLLSSSSCDYYYGDEFHFEFYTGFDQCCPNKWGSSSLYCSTNCTTVTVDLFKDHICSSDKLYFTDEFVPGMCDNVYGVPTVYNIDPDCPGYSDCDCQIDPYWPVNYATVRGTSYSFHIRPDPAIPELFFTQPGLTRQVAQLGIRGFQFGIVPQHKGSSDYGTESYDFDVVLIPRGYNSNSNCGTLKQCLSTIYDASQSPYFNAVTPFYIFLQPRTDFSESDWNQMDYVIRDIWGSSLITPSDILEDYKNLRDSVLPGFGGSGWPPLYTIAGNAFFIITRRQESYYIGFQNGAGRAAFIDADISDNRGGDIIFLSAKDPLDISVNLVEDGYIFRTLADYLFVEDLVGLTNDDVIRKNFKFLNIYEPYGFVDEYEILEFLVRADIPEDEIDFVLAEFKDAIERCGGLEDGLAGWLIDEDFPAIGYPKLKDDFENFIETQQRNCDALASGAQIIFTSYPQPTGNNYGSYAFSLDPDSAYPYQLIAICDPVFEPPCSAPEQGCDVSLSVTTCDGKNYDRGLHQKLHVGFGKCCYNPAVGFTSVICDSDCKYVTINYHDEYGCSEYSKTFSATYLPGQCVSETIYPYFGQASLYYELSTPCPYCDSYRDDNELTDYLSDESGGYYEGICDCKPSADWKINEITVKGTHKSYHTRPNPSYVDTYYSHPPLETQLRDGVKYFEFDIIPRYYNQRWRMRNGLLSYDVHEIDWKVDSYYDLTISTYDTVRWIWADFLPHAVTVVGCDGYSECDIYPYDSVMLPPYSSYEVTFEKPGEYSFYCPLHPNMMGCTISVYDAQNQYSERNQYLMDYPNENQYERTGIDYDVLSTPMYDEGSNCGNLRQCLYEIHEWSKRGFSETPYYIYLNPKAQLSSSDYDDLDYLIKGVWGSDMYSPDQLRRNKGSLHNSVLYGSGKGWPSLYEAKGKAFFILNDKYKQYNSEHQYGEGRSCFVLGDYGDEDTIFAYFDNPEDSKIIKAVREGYMVKTRADKNFVQYMPSERDMQKSLYDVIDLNRDNRCETSEFTDYLTAIEYEGHIPLIVAKIYEVAFNDDCRNGNDNDYYMTFEQFYCVSQQGGFPFFKRSSDYPTMDDIYQKNKYARKSGAHYLITDYDRANSDSDYYFRLDPRSGREYSQYLCNPVLHPCQPDN